MTDLGRSELPSRQLGVLVGWAFGKICAQSDFLEIKLVTPFNLVSVGLY